MARGAHRQPGTALQPGPTLYTIWDGEVRARVGELGINPDNVYRDSTNQLTNGAGGPVFGYLERVRNAIGETNDVVYTYARPSGRPGPTADTHSSEGEPSYASPGLATPGIVAEPPALSRAGNSASAPSQQGQAGQSHGAVGQSEGHELETLRPADTERRQDGRGTGGDRKDSKGAKCLSCCNCS